MKIVHDLISMIVTHSYTKAAKYCRLDMLKLPIYVIQFYLIVIDAHYSKHEINLWSNQNK